MSEKICAVIITYNIDETIIDVVLSVIDQTDHVVIIDNNSKNKTINILQSINENERVEVVFNNENKGIATALNQGVKIAKEKGYKWVITLDHDSICNENMIKNMLAIKNQYKEEVAVLAPQVFEVKKKDYISSKNNKGKYTEVKDCIQSGSLFNISIFDKIGYFNEDLFIYHVDFDFCQRILKGGYKIIQCNNTVLYQEEGYKLEKKFLGKKTFYNNYSSPAIYYITRNTIYMAKNYSLIYIKRIIKDFIYIILYDGLRKERLKYWRLGLAHGIKGKYGKLEI